MVALRSGNCERCGKAFEKKWPYHPQRFCSGSCKTLHRRDTGVDDIEVRCAQCGETFDCNRYRLKKFCCEECYKRSRIRPRVTLRRIGGG